MIELYCWPAKKRHGARGRFAILEDLLDGLGLPFELAFIDFAQVKDMPLDKLPYGHPFVSRLRNARML